MKSTLKYFVICTIGTMLIFLSVVGETVKASSLKGVWEKFGYKLEIPINISDVYDMDHDPILERAVEYLQSKK